MAPTSRPPAELLAEETKVFERLLTLCVEHGLPPQVLRLIANGVTVESALPAMRVVAGSNSAGDTLSVTQVRTAQNNARDGKIKLIGDIDSLVSDVLSNDPQVVSASLLEVCGAELMAVSGSRALRSASRAGAAELTSQAPRPRSPRAPANQAFRPRPAPQLARRRYTLLCAPCSPDASCRSCAPPAGARPVVARWRGPFVRC